MNTKICSKCKIEKTVDCFRKEKRTKNGLQAQCKMCKKQYGRKTTGGYHWQYLEECNGNN